MRSFALCFEGCYQPSELIGKNDKHCGGIYSWQVQVKKEKREEHMAPVSVGLEQHMRLCGLLFWSMIVMERGSTCQHRVWYFRLAVQVA